MFSEEQIRAIVRDEVQNESLREGGLTDHCRSAALNALIDIIKCEFRNLNAELREEFGLNGSVQ
jgi:hypothetical protein